jgi:hypothetical protein
MRVVAGARELEERAAMAEPWPLVAPIHLTSIA